MSAPAEKFEFVAPVSPGTGEENYRHIVNRLMETGSDVLISNGVPQHAAALIECFFRNAAVEVKIVSESLRQDVYDTADVVNSFLGAVRRGISVQFIVRNIGKSEGHFASVLKSASLEKGNRVFLKTNVSDSKMLQEDVAANFAIMDRKAFRFETSSGVACKAFASMNNPVIAGDLGVIFDRLYSSLDAEEASASAPSI